MSYRALALVLVGVHTIVVPVSAVLIVADATAAREAPRLASSDSFVPLQEGREQAARASASFDPSPEPASPSPEPASPSPGWWRTQWVSVVNVRRSDLPEIVQAFMAPGRGSYVPATGRWNPDGIRLIGLGRSDSLLWTFGFREGDVLHSINGIGISEHSSDLPFVRDALTHLDFAITREGRRGRLIFMVVDA